MAGTGVENLFTLKNVRLSFPHIFKPQQTDEGEGGFEASGLISPDDPQIAELNKLIDVVGAQTFKAQWPTVKKALIAQDRMCLHNGDTKADKDGYAGNWFVKARSDAKPLVIDRDKTILTQADGKPYSGCYCDINFQVWGQNNKYGKRINASLRYVQFRRDGDAFSAVPPARLDEVPDISEEDDSTPPEM